MITAEQIHKIEFKHVSIGGIPCFLWSFCSKSILEYSHMLKEQEVQKVSEKDAESLGMGNIH